jgi:microcystin degradation protein MlrC
LKIGVAEFSHETCTFCPDPTTIALLEPHVKRGQAMLDKVRGIPTYVNGFMKVAEAEGLTLLPILSVGMAPGGFTSWFETECFDKYSYEIAEGLKQAGPLDGVLLALHGAMAVTGVPKPEAELVRRVRRAVGDIPIMVTLDLHANEDAELTEAADAVFILKTYPHIDSEEIGMVAARCMVETLKGNFKPTQALRKPGIMSASIYQASAYHPMKLVYDRCRVWEKQDGVYCVSVAPGFAYADVPDVGMSVIAVANDDRALAERIADDVSALAWSLKEALSEPLPSPAEAVALAIKHISVGEKPVVLADGSDRTGDSTHVLKELLAQGATNWAIPGIADPRASHYLAENHKVGDQVTVSIGGWASEHSGEPVEVEGTVEFIGRPSFTLVGPMGKGAKVQDGLVVSLNLGSNRHVVVSERMRGANDSAPLTAVGIDVSTLDIVILKDRVHHRAFWDDVAKVDIRVDSPGIGVADLTKLHYDNVPTDTYPVGAKWRK